MKNTGICSAICLLLFFASCKSDKNTDSIPPQEDLVNMIIVKRGAFHYDTFELEDTIVKFIPKDSGMIEEFPQYTMPSETHISKEESNDFFEQIVEMGFFELKDNYKSKTTDNSMLEVSVAYNGKIKTVASEDFQRNCPEVLQFIENEMVRLHGKDLKRRLLPG
ncbi:DUF6438 domain-containing protein [Nonlabens antarcticus]|uniref:DUF6438 domain-containing protein n=1 Tax=Nonlabens antarcticus TaxID=392714 RepID=UPI001890ED95|nr:hypothetical protein [Nonlabens antarcticus]